MPVETLRKSLWAAVIGSVFIYPCSANDIAAFLAQKAPEVHDQRMFSRVGNPDQVRMHFPGFSIMPPEGEGWIDGPPPPVPDANRPYLPQTHVIFFKVAQQRSPQFGSHSILANVVSSLNPPNVTEAIAKNHRGFVEYLMRMAMETDKVTAANSKRIKVISQNAYIDESIGYVCFRYDAELEDTGVPGLPGTFLLIASSYNCVSPSAHLMVSLQVSQRIPPHGVPADLGDEAADFFKSLKFEPLQVTGEHR